MDRDLISVIIPAYQAEKYIEEAALSVLKQKGEFDIELIIINDASTDNTDEVIKKLVEIYSNIIYIKNEKNKGVVYTRNLGIKYAQGKYIAFLDADDYWAEGKLAIQLGEIKRKDAPICYTARKLVSETGEDIYKKEFIEIPEEIGYYELLKTNVIPCSSVLVRANIVKDLKFIGEDLHEDYLLWLRILMNEGSAIGINKPLLLSRMSKGGRSRNKFKSARMHWRVYKYLGIGRIKAIRYFISYALAGWKKYH